MGGCYGCANSVCYCVPVLVRGACAVDTMKAVAVLLVGCAVGWWLGRRQVEPKVHDAARYMWTSADGTCCVTWT
jgi:hypothetical protein